MKFTEDDVISANAAFIKNMCRLNSQGMEYHDCEAEALLGFLLAIRNYQKGVSDFKSYAEIYVKNHIRQIKRENNRNTRCQSRLSMDKRINNYQETIGSRLLCGNDDFEEVISLKDFVDRLDQELKTLVWLYENDYTEKEILKVMHLTGEYLYKIKSRLIDEFKMYYSNCAR